MPARVLIIDDSRMLVELCVSALRSAGLEAEGAIDLAELDQQLSQAKFDLILVDVNMPEMFGDDVIEFLRAQKKLEAKLVLYSDLAASELEAKATASGADGYIGKSGGVEGMVAEVKHLLGPAQAPTEPVRRRRVLIVDDSEVTASLLGADLDAKGFEVLTASNAEAATKIILKKKTRPDLVLLDVRMPNVNGEQFCRFIKGNSLFSGIKVLLCSSEQEEELQRICRDAGADGYVTKDSVLSKVLDAELA